jgi:hypothetical protein
VRDDSTYAYPTLCKNLWKLIYLYILF